MKLFYLSFLLFLSFSCKSVKIQNINEESVQQLTGNIQQIDVLIYSYSEERKDSLISLEKVIQIFNSDNKIAKEIERNIDVEFIYDKGLLVAKKYHKKELEEERDAYKYDKNNNLIEFIKYINDSTVHIVHKKYDKKNNEIEASFVDTRFSYNNSSLEKYLINYYKRSVNIISFDDFGKEKPSTLKHYFDNKGKILKTEQYEKYIDLSADTLDFFTIVTYDYDSKGNLFNKITSFHHSNEVIINHFEYVFDTSGNIIEKREYVNNQLVKKTTYQITYRNEL